ncbi:hypothetical protein RHGRI_018885 [Rhododendron griersonianum]|uniref:Uncharacterized protein n=1 Tax=Rhododendron griersonianum TaxID=479676 RepID=A0AAV6K344_9ERIC|nr:hypothetical protein RHGRI_018885 [Rhododendron griersonianum]
MAFFHYYCILLFVISTLILKQTLGVNIGAANDHDWLAQAECHSTGVPETTCMQCLNSDHRTANVENISGGDRHHCCRLCK